MIAPLLSTQRSPQSQPPPAEQRLLVDARELARMLSVSVRTIRTWDAMGRLPKPIRPGGGHCVRWAMRSIEAWVAAGAPNRQVFEQLASGERS